jgi:hypothetical protein
LPAIGARAGRVRLTQKMREVLRGFALGAALTVAIVLLAWLL